MLDLSTQDPADLAAAPRAAEAEALTAAGTFGAVLRAIPEFAALLAAENALAADAKANEAIEAFQSRQAELRPELMMRVLTVAQRDELERLQKAMLTIPTVADYVAATAAFQSVCRETAVVVSAQIGIDFAANCRSGGCCG
jgi:cell fate (sporulation/competence/biofilm development) regulator YlbF (YheA/YmcA/DUF963 family)